MNILAIDSIGNKTSVASKIGDDLLSISVNHKRKDRPDWQSLLKTINVTSKDLSAFDLFVFGQGPGSYTSIRSVATFLKAIALVQQKPLMALSNLECIAFGHSLFFTNDSIIHTSIASDIDSEIEIHFDITGSSKTEGKMTDIQSFFGDRLKQIRNQLISGGALPRRPVSIAEAWRNRQRHTSKDYEITLVGLASDSRWSRAGNLNFVLEDETQNVFCTLKPPSGISPLHPSLDGLMDDDVVGISGHFYEKRFSVSDIHLPPMRQHSKATAGEDRAVSAAFLSDVHVGSKTFLGPQWEKMIQWFNTDPLARTVKYFVLSGDGVDGVGIYPGQERHLAITDLFAQYGELARLLEGLPDWVDVIILPGNHDAVRPAEPQPALDPEVQQDYSDAVFVGNPCEFSLHGVRILSYHGKSIDDFVAGLRSVTYSKPEMAMRAMLERRHLAPSWGGKTPLSPEPEDRMVIQQTPDIFVTGHVHGHYVGNHKGATIVHSSTWQDQTDYQMMLGFQPKPCILTVINLHTHESASIPFA